MNNRVPFSRRWYPIRLVALSLTLATPLAASVAAPGPVLSQVLLERKVSFKAEAQTIESVLNQLEKQLNVRFVYSPSLIGSDRRVTLQVAEKPLTQVLDELLAPRKIQYEVRNNRIILSQPGSSKTTADVPVSGRVVDAKGEGLPGVTVVVKGTTIGTGTGPDGSFSINAPENSVLVFSFVGYTRKEVPVAGATSTISVTLAEDTKALDEVVVVGYGVQEKKLLTTSIATVSAKDVELLPVASPAEALVGQVAGAQITEPSGEPGAGAVIRIRGLGSISAGNSPLYVVDGYPLGSADNFNQISPLDIQSIQVLKDAAACAIYGSRGGNGIVIVTTKRGQAGKTRFNFNANTGIQQVAKRIDVLNRNQYLDYLTDAFTNGNRVIPAPLQVDRNTLADTDWQDEIFQTGVQQRYQLSASGGSDKSRFYIAGSYFDQSGIVKGTGFERFSLRANYDAQLSKKLKIGLNLAPSFTRTDVRPVSGSYNGGNISGGGPGGETAAVTTALILPPVVPARLPNGDYGLISNAFPANTITISDLLNPVAPLDLYKDRTSSVRALGTTFLEYEPVKGLMLRTNFGAELIANRRGIYVPATLPTNNSRSANLSNPVLNNIDARQVNSTNYNWVWENTATYNRTFAKDHNVTVLAGYASQYNTNEGSTVLGQTGTYTNTAVEYATAAGQLFGQASYSANSLTSLFGRVDYAFKERYILTAALRTDGSSRFGPDNRYATFPSVALAWRVGEENFIKRLPSVSELKLRASYGVTGNNNIGDYSYQSYQQAANYVFGANTGTRAYGFSPNGVAIRDLTWETNTQFDTGFDLGLFRDRVYLTVAAYQRNTTDLLLNRNIPAVLGFSTRALANVGEVRNRGLEFQLNTSNFQGKDFTWSTSANMSFNRNRVMALAGQNDQLVYDAVFGYTSSIRVVPGQPLGMFYGYEQVGVYRDQNDVDNSPKFATGTTLPGDIKYADKNGDGIINAADISVIGNPFPNFTYGLLNTFGYKRLSLAITLQGSQGNDILYGGDRYVNNFPGQANPRTNVLDRWRSPEEPGNGMEPRASSNPSPSIREFSSRFVFDASFLRIRNVTLRYNLPTGFVQKIGLQNADVYTSIQNLYTFTKYFGYNPEANNYGNTTQPTYGVDQGSYPMARTLTLGVNIGF
ncbi:TonB-dependent receptor [Hymenobacter sp. GOD-10R]|uniref:TonB-dependent receptor n=1 Tax=Hymenobacter sp. GOD-10R TaxID=3093922 RepID=UPI002D787723|nr:TonB-dependent receptor [Hymenobacter sp. GOD-10R]WRQ29534.1 TonB-dependent receptor [Hymenobacter sp. GOD-10R]